MPLINTQIFNSKQIKKAAELIKKGELIVFPTETVYGLGADALNTNAVKKIFIAKGRPSDNPLIIHIAEKKQLSEVAIISNTKKALIHKLIKKFWPGPLTLILEKTKKIPLAATAGLNTVAIRMPKNKIALNLIKFSNTPIAAPSANLSGKPSGTSFKHVFEDFNEKVAGIIKSKSCEIGVESTVLDLTSKIPTLLRPGGVSLEELKKVLPVIHIGFNKKTNKVKSPGMKYKHYSPKAKIILFEGSGKEEMENYKKKYTLQGEKIKVIYPEKIKNFPKRLFSIFRECDIKKMDYILITAMDEKGIGLAIMNRIKKAAFKIIK